MSQFLAPSHIVEMTSEIIIGKVKKLKPLRELIGKDSIDAWSLQTASQSNHPPGLFFNMIMHAENSRSSNGLLPFWQSQLIFQLKCLWNYEKEMLLNPGRYYCLTALSLRSAFPLLISEILSIDMLDITAPDPFFPYLTK